MAVSNKGLQAMVNGIQGITTLQLKAYNGGTLLDSQTVTFDVATAGSTVLSNQVVAAKDYKIVSGLNNGAQTLVNVSTSHGTAAQNAEVIYNTLVT